MRDDEGLIFVYSSGVSIPKYSLDIWFIKICTDSHLAGVALEAPTTEVTGNIFHNMLQLKLLKLIENKT